MNIVKDILQSRLTPPPEDLVFSMSRSHGIKITSYGSLKTNKSCMCHTLSLSQEEIISSINLRDKLGGSLITAEAETGCGADSSNKKMGLLQLCVS